MSTILVDVDGVLANFTGRFIEIAQRVTGRQIDLSHAYTDFKVEKSVGLTSKEASEVYKHVSKPDFAWTLEPLIDGIEAVTELMRTHEVVFVTKPFRGSKTWVWERTKWLQKYFGANGKNVIFTSQKHLVFGDVLIEDSGLNATNWQDYQCRVVGNTKAKALLRHYPYNHEFNLARFTDWSVAVALINKL